MPRFVLIPGSGLSLDANLASNAANVPVQLTLRDPLLNAPGPVTVTASVQLAGNRHTVTLQGSFPTPLRLWNGLLELTAITLTLRYGAPGTAGDPPLETDGISAIGSVTWAHARSLGFESAPAFNLRYDSAARRFSIDLAQPTRIPGGLAEIKTAKLSAELPASRPAVIFTLEGTAGLTDAGSSNALQLVKQLFGNIAPTLPQTGACRIRQELSLAGGVPTVVQAPAFDLSLPGLRLPTLPGIPTPLDLSLGVPQCRFPLSLPLPAGFTLRFADCGIRFPSIPALSGANLLGNLEWVTSSNGNRLAFEPTLPGGFDLPDVVRFLMSRLSWLGSALPLQQIVDAATLSPEELDWQGLFSGLLPATLPTNLDLAPIRTGLAGLVDAALKTTQIGRERIFLLAFQGLARAGQKVLTIIWDLWFEITKAEGHTGIPAFLRGALALPASLFHAITTALAKCAALKPGQLVDAIFAAADGLAAQFNDFLALLVRTLATLLRELDDKGRAALAGAFRSALLTLAGKQRPAGFSLASRAGFRLDPLLADVSRSPAEMALMATVLGLATASPSFLAPITASAQNAGALPRLWNTITAPFAAVMEGLEIEVHRIIGFFTELVKPDPAWDASQRRRAEEVMMLIATYPVIGQLFTFIVVAAMAIPNAFRYAQSLGGLMSKPINKQSGRLVETLPPGKYLVFSDIHRDVRADDLGALQIGSIDHFSANAPLYLRLLDWADREGYTVLEAGDCEELWCIRSAAAHETPNAQGETGFPKKLREIIATHQGIYDKLRSLHHRNRYFRVIGNHDSYLRDKDVFAILKSEMERPSGNLPVKPFEIPEYLIIPEVKKMLEHTLVDAVLSDLWGNDKDGAQKKDLVRRLLDGRLGMDSSDYQELCPMLVAHGHQLDFWNNDANSLVGKLITNAAGAQADYLLDPLLDLRGIALGGSPAIDFVDMAATLPVWNNWPGEQAAVKFAHRVQHTANSERKLVDDIFYSESFAAIFGTLFMAINGKDAQGREVTPSTSAINMDSYQEFKTFFERHHNHHICLGHTHNPQSQPYFTSTNLPVLGKLTDFFADLVSLLKSRYLNSGTAGWMDGVIWAIEVGDDKQARLVYWTRNSAEPENMDWELTRLDPAVKRQINQTVDGVLAYLRNAGEALGAAASELGGDLAKQLSLPFDAFAALLMRGGVNGTTSKLGTLSEVRPGNGGTLDWFANQEKIQLNLISYLAQFRGRVLGRSAAAPQTFTIELPLDRGVRDTLGQLSRWFDGATSPGAPALAAAAVVHSLMDRFPRNLPTLGRTQRLLGAPSPFESAAPALNSFASLLPLLPVFGEPIQVANQKLSARIDLTPQALRMTLTMEAV